MAIGEQIVVMEQLQKRQVHLSNIAVQAQQWARLSQQKSQIIRSMGDAKAVIDNADQIEENGQRFDYLSKYLPKLSKLAKDRQNLTQIDNQIQKNTQLIEQSTIELDELRQKNEQLKKKRSQVKDYSSLLTEAKTLSAEANRLLNRFRTLDGKSACDSCGQPLTADHFETEQKRREQVLNGRQKNEQQLQIQNNQSVSLRTKLEKDKKTVEGRILKVESRLRENQSGRELLASKKEMITQTAMDLLDQDYTVQVAADAVSSRTDSNKQLGLDRMLLEGVVQTSVEMVLFELQGFAKGERFRELAKLVK